MCLIAAISKHMGRRLSTRERMRQVMIGRKRFFSEYQVLGRNSTVQPDNLIHALSILESWAKDVREVAGAGSVNKLLIFSMNEFSMYSAHRPATREEFGKIIARAAELAKTLPLGVLWSLGTIPNTTGDITDEGLKVAANTGLLFEGGTGDVIQFNKMNRSQLDGWDYSVYYFNDGNEARMVRVKDPNGGNDAILGVRICVEYRTHPVDRPEPQVLLVPSYGMSPNEVALRKFRYDLILTNEQPWVEAGNPAMDDPADVEVIDNMSGVYTREPNALKLKLRRMVDFDGEPGVLGSMLRSYLELASPSMERVNEWLANPDVVRSMISPSSGSKFWTSDVKPLRHLTPEEVIQFREMESEGKFLPWRTSEHEHHEHGGHHE